MVRLGYLATFWLLLLFGQAPALRKVLIGKEGHAIGVSDEGNLSAFAIEAGTGETRDIQADQDKDKDNKIKATMTQGSGALNSIEGQTLTTDEDEDGETLNDFLGETHIHLPYYMQLFTPISRGQDHRLPAKALNEQHPETALSEPYQADEETNDQKTNRSIPIGQSLIQDKEQVAQFISAEAECLECQEFIKEIILGCCAWDAAHENIECDVRTCEQGTFKQTNSTDAVEWERIGIKYSDLIKLPKFMDTNMRLNPKTSSNNLHFKRLYMDFTALGSILHKARQVFANLNGRQGGLPARDLCYLYMTETYNCNGNDVKDDKIHDRMPTKVISIQKYRTEVCKGIKLPQVWGTKRMCPRDSTLEGDVSIVADNLGKVDDRSGQQNTNKRAPPQPQARIRPDHDEDVFGIGFPEVPIKYNTNTHEWEIHDTDEKGFMDSNKRQTMGAYLAAGNKSQKVHDKLVRKLIEGMPNQNNGDGQWLKRAFDYWRAKDDSEERKKLRDGLDSKGRAIDAMKAMGIILFDFKKDEFAVENIPYFLRNSLEMFYKHVDSSNWATRNWARFKKSAGETFAGTDLQNIGYKEIAKYESTDQATKRKHITGYIQDYLPDLREAELITECTVGPPYYEPDKSGMGKRIKWWGVKIRSEKHRLCVEEAVGKFDNYNAFFARRLHLGRPFGRDYICYNVDKDVCTEQETYKKRPNYNPIVSPADSRLILAETLEDTNFWIKGEQFNLKSLVDLGDPGHYNYFRGGTMLIARLAPQDYHRFHFPIDGKITHFKHYPGAYYSVNPIAIGHEGTPVFHANKRMHATIKTKKSGCVLYVSVAATNVGSIGHTSYVGQDVVIGMEHGFMQFGGSTVLIIFPKGVAAFDDKIKLASGVPIETVVKAGELLGRLHDLTDVDLTDDDGPVGPSPCDMPSDDPSERPN